MDLFILTSILILIANFFATGSFQINGGVIAPPYHLPNNVISAAAGL